MIRGKVVTLYAGMKNKKVIYVFAAAAALFIVSCSARQDVTLRTGGSGTSTLSVELHPVFTGYYNDLASGFSASYDPADPRFFDLAGIREGFARNPGLELVSARTPEPHRLELEFRFRDFAETVRSQDPRVRDVISLTRSGGTETLRIYLERQNLASILTLTPEGDSAMAKMLLPPQDREVSEEEYLEHLAWALEDYARGEDIERILRSSAINLNIKVQGRIISQTGGTIRGESEATFSIPILRLFTLKKPEEFTLSYR